MIVHQATFRLVGTVDASAVVQELSESSLQDVVDFVVCVIAEMGPDAQRAVIEALNGLEWIEEEEEVDDPLADD